MAMSDFKYFSLGYPLAQYFHTIIYIPIQVIIRQKTTGTILIVGIIGTILTYGTKTMMTRCQHGIAKNTIIVTVVTILPYSYNL